MPPLAPCSGASSRTRQPASSTECTCASGETPLRTAPHAALSPFRYYPPKAPARCAAFVCWARMSAHMQRFGCLCAETRADGGAAEATLARRCRHSTHVAGRRCPLWQDSRSDPRPSGFHRCTYHWCNAGDAIDPNLQHVIHSGAGIEPLVLGKSTIAGIQRKVNLFNRILINADEDGHISRPCRPSCQVDDIARGL